MKKNVCKIIFILILMIASEYYLLKLSDVPDIQVSDKVIVINQGHSNHASYRDPGAVGYVDEAELNEQIAVQLAGQLEYYGYKVYLTHPAPGFDGPTLVTADEALDLSGEIVPAINALNPDLVISIHNNSSKPSWKSGYLLYWSSYKRYLDNSPDIYEIEGKWWNGDTAFFDPTPCSAALKSKALAELLYDSLGKSFRTDLSVQRDRIHKNNSLGTYLIPGFKCIHERDDCILAMTNSPCVLIECGYVSNRSDVVFLQNTLNQVRLAKYITSAINRLFYLEQ